ncbi:uncharacterized protein MELLADRAFT_96249 [Melampsora larici-populina 98AG31]|uniref:Uncharacterized protein n=1 Tax=Melampsora larici-populina (strain 98AG31 / pathotype 3-4-7) TaxID=747676 RepID=F4RE36_MELLP|nr:uncharacterized protein MELLADRAFT_96249 [Melampsora larici-populina 98AG31]EGG09343.1 hypothetical protein MELLADRAFT_96249 [Melampsora larici-populina 98AG31]
MAIQKLAIPAKNQINHPQAQSPPWVICTCRYQALVARSMTRDQILSTPSAATLLPGLLDFSGNLPPPYSPCQPALAYLSAMSPSHLPGRHPQVALPHPIPPTLASTLILYTTSLGNAHLPRAETSPLKRPVRVTPAPTTTLLYGTSVAYYYDVFLYLWSESPVKFEDEVAPAPESAASASNLCGPDISNKQTFQVSNLWQLQVPDLPDPKKQGPGGHRLSK